MNSAVIKALTRRIEDRMGSGRKAAIAAGVQPSVWSGYVSDDHPQLTIPFGRLLLVANAEERRAFAELLVSDPDGPDGDLDCEAQEVTEDAAELQHRVRHAKAEGLSRRAAREIVKDALHLRAEVDHVINLAERRA